VQDAWTIEDGILKSHKTIRDWGADLRTVKKYRDFVLLVDFRFPSISDSGIWFRGIPGIMGGMEQFNLMSVCGTGNLDGLIIFRKTCNRHMSCSTGPRSPRAAKGGLDNWFRAPSIQLAGRESPGRGLTVRSAEWRL